MLQPFKRVAKAVIPQNIQALRLPVAMTRAEIACYLHALSGVDTAIE